MSTAAIITISDSRSDGANTDVSGDVAAECVSSLAFQITHRQIIPDDAAVIGKTVKTLLGTARLIVTTGGTGIGPRDVTPEALRPLIERDLPGFGEIMRTGTFAKTPLSILSRGGAGVAGNTLIVMLPGSPKGVRECLDLLGPAIKHAVKVLTIGKLDCQAETSQGLNGIA
ncbi:MAG: MogA/MoaB family molybdenum cofactor biosynthesis protein [Planctomycetes bacterium]|nr:MogA/MoaB family molybdenum cofactor biosynthesis protein [Planctomycetota bacterium]